MTLSHAMPSATELLPLLPELVLIDSAFALLIIDLFIGERDRGQIGLDRLLPDMRLGDAVMVGLVQLIRIPQRRTQGHLPT